MYQADSTILMMRTLNQGDEIKNETEILLDKISVSFIHSFAIVHCFMRLCNGLIDQNQPPLDPYVSLFLSIHF